jgi:cytochrome c oxidase subunit II
MKPIIRTTTIAATVALVGLILALGAAGSSPANAQPPPQTVPQPSQTPGTSDTAAVPAPTVQQVDKGAASSSAPGEDAKPGPQPAPEGTPAPPPGAPGAPAAAPATPGKPAIVEVVCDTVSPAATLTGAGDIEIATGGVVKFQLPPGVAILTRDPKSAGLEVDAGQTRCLRFESDGQYVFLTRSGQPGAITARQWYDILVNKQVDDLAGGNFWMPKAVNLTADDSDLMYYATLALSLFFFVGILGAIIYFVIKYRHRPGHKPQESPAHNDALEITWTVIPTIICVFLFYYGWTTYIRVVTPPTKAVEINVLALRWNWQFTHSNGAQDSDLHVPVNTPVRLVMTSKDVLHAFYAPVMRVKQDIIPRRYTYAWFYPTKPGTYRLTCAEYCGTNHSQMGITESGRRAVVVVHEPGGYERYLADKASLSLKLPPAELGKMLYEKKGCNACHTTDGSQRVGPTFLKSFGTSVPLADGSQIKMDETYIRESLMYPQAKARSGFPPSMPSFEGQLKELEIEGLIAFIKSLQ